MVKRFVLCMLLMTCTLFSHQCDLAICAIFRDDAYYMREWINFHQKQGVKKFYLYDNFSKDSPEVELKDYIKEGVVEIIPWKKTHTNHDEWIAVQCGAYMHFVKKNKNKIKWCAFIDTDEFLFCTNGKKLTKFLKKFEDYEQISIPWVLFGTSNIKKAEKGKLTKTLFLRSEIGFNVWSKAIVRLDKIVSCPSMHYFITQNQSKQVDENFKQCLRIRENPTYNKIRINHYSYRDLNFFWNVKMKRLEQQGRPYYQNLIDEEAQCNAVYDDSILKAY